MPRGDVGLNKRVVSLESVLENLVPRVDTLFQQNENLLTNPWSPLGSWVASTNTPTIADADAHVAGSSYIAADDNATFNPGGGIINVLGGDLMSKNAAGIWFKSAGIGSVIAGLATVALARATLDVMTIGEIEDRQLSKSPSNGLYFDGTDKVEMVTGAAADFGTGDFSASGIAYFATTPGDDSALCDKRRGGGTTAGFMVYINSSGRLIFEMGDGSTGVNGTNDGADLTGKLFHWAVSFDRSGNATRYVNGVAYGVVDAITTAGGSVTNAHGVRIGERGADKRFTGNIHSTLLFNRALTAAEILRLSINGNVPESDYQNASGSEVVTNGEFATDTTGWTATASTISRVSGSSDPGTVSPGSDDWVLKVVDAGGSARATTPMTCVVGQRYNTSGYFYNPTGQQPYAGSVRVSATEDGIAVAGAQVALPGDSAAWTAFSVTWVATASTMYFQLWPDSPTSSICYIDGISTKSTGVVLALQPDNIESDGDWIDASTNRLNGTTTGAIPLAIRQRLDLADANAAAGEQVLSVGTGFSVKKSGYVNATRITIPTSELTIATAVVTATGSRHTVDTQSDDPTDALATINGGEDGMKLILSPESDARTVTVQHGTGNITLAGSADFVMDAIEDTIELVYLSSVSAWVELSRSNNAT
tara:strand:+ start:7888 stop:9837 length:1950 start_codon:yes stop_codon:yes gene_type:complete